MTAKVGMRGSIERPKLVIWCSLYKLIMMLFREAKAVQVSVKLLSDGKVQRMTSKSHSHVRAKLVKLWNEYDQREKSPEQLLHACTHMYAPVES